MQAYKINKKAFWVKGFKNLLIKFSIQIFSIFVFSLFININQELFITIVFTLLLMECGNFITQLHIKEIQVDKEKNEISFFLKSIYSGEKIKKYILGKISSQLVKNTGFRKYFYGELSLKMKVSDKEIFDVTNRYGFYNDTLISIENTLNQ